MKINSCFLFALFLLLAVSLAFAVETSQHDQTMKAKGATEMNKVEAEAKGAAEDKKVEPTDGGGGGGNWGGGGGGGNWGGGGYGCRHGCCYRGYRGCQKCCSSPEEAKALAAEKKLHP